MLGSKKFFWGWRFLGFVASLFKNKASQWKNRFFCLFFPQLCVLMFANTHFEIRMWGAPHLSPSCPEGFHIRNSNDWIYWLKNSEGAVLVPRHQSSYSQMTGVFNHLFSIVFKFHCHSQKVTGSLGVVLCPTIPFLLLSGSPLVCFRGDGRECHQAGEASGIAKMVSQHSDSAVTHNITPGPSKTNTHPKIHMDTKNVCFAKW